MSLFKKRKKDLLKGELTQREVINKVKAGEIVYGTFCGMQSHYGRKTVSHFSIELHPPMKLKLETEKDNFISQTTLFDDEDTDIIFFERSFSKVTNVDTGEEIKDYSKMFQVLKFFEDKKSADFYYLKRFKDFYNEIGFGKSIKYFKTTYKEMVETDPDLVMKIIGK